MVVKEIQAVLKAHVGKPGEGVFKLSRDAGVAFETARRTVQGIGNPTVSTTNALLVATGHTLRVVTLAATDAPPEATALAETKNPRLVSEGTQNSEVDMESLQVSPA